jgi:hypothetical protein
MKEKKDKVHKESILSGKEYIGLINLLILLTFLWILSKVFKNYLTKGYFINFRLLRTILV